MTWLNSPFSRPEDVCRQPCKKKTCVQRGHHLEEPIHGAKHFAKKAVEELQEKRVEAIAWHGPAAMDTNWFKALWDWTHYRIDYSERICYNESDGGGTFASQTLILRPYRRTTYSCPTVLKPVASDALAVRRADQVSLELTTPGDEPGCFCDLRCDPDDRKALLACSCVCHPAAAASMGPGFCSTCWEVEGRHGESCPVGNLADGAP